ncbi:MAG: hypothetical protein Q7S03_03850 [bacterium]|nr:hypothetical protein [bacterium]
MVVLQPTGKVPTFDQEVGQTPGAGVGVGVPGGGVGVGVGRAPVGVGVDVGRGGGGGAQSGSLAQLLVPDPDINTQESPIHVK